ncbi:MAG: hypothetical protein KAG86_05965 [Gammaproteobacteria bacterium]|jgi:uncharacterized protein|nr:hypothetical protein [Gammaproteobacteria bacterium]|tara:strand:+ start:691 stop:1047 length:357 start_codon:yes stop_codon:yes gene_type:complete
MKETYNSLIESVGSGKIQYQGKWYEESLIIGIDKIIYPWKHPSVADLEVSDFESAFEGNTEVILLGTGRKQVFPDTHLVTKILKRGVGIEVMDSKSACRTFNLLVSEYRRPLAMLMLE